MLLEQERGEPIEGLQAKRNQKKQAKKKMKQLQFSGYGADKKLAQTDEDSDGDADETSQ